MQDGQDGGSFLAAGAYGCVYKPAMPCSIGEASMSGSVGKLFVNEKQWKIENKNTDLLTYMDRNLECFIYPIRACSFPKDESHEPQSEIDKCKLNIKKAPLLFQTVMPNAGLTIVDFLRINMPSEGWPLSSFVKLMIPIFKGVDRLIKFGCVHQDIKFDNVVADKNGKVRLIDFGLMLQHAYFYDYNFLFHIYDDGKAPFLNPPEYRLFRGDRYLKSLTISDLNQTSRPYTRTSAPFTSYIHGASLEKLQQDRWNHPGNDLSIDPRFSTSYAFRNFAVQREWHRKSDIFSLGLLMINVSNHLKSTDRGNPYLMALINGMIMPHPDDRLTIPEIFNLLVKMSFKAPQEKEYTVIAPANHVPTTPSPKLPDGIDWSPAKVQPSELFDGMQ